MTVYNVHLYREMRLYFPGIEAATPNDAARIAADSLTEDAACTEDCQGETLAAMIDVVGDHEFSQTVTIDFEAERLRKAVPELMEALAYQLEQTVDMDLKHGIRLSEGEQDARSKALAVIAKASDSQTERVPV
jgi:hypothetical protein